MSDNASSGSGTERASGDAEGMVGRTIPPAPGGPSEGPDVHLDVPLLKVDEISLEVENLDAHVSLVAQVRDLGSSIAC